MLEGKNPDELTEDFAIFCCRQITKNNEKFTHIDPYIPDQNHSKIYQFCIDDKEVLEMMSAFKNKSCELDTMPMALLKKILPRCIDMIT